MFQGVKYTVKSVQERFFCLNTHTEELKVKSADFLRICVRGSSAGKGSEAIFTISAFIFVLVGASAPLMGLGGGDM